MSVDKQCRYHEWDESSFVLPGKYNLDSESELADALKVFFEVGGYDFFDVEDPKYYASEWLDFVRNLFNEIMEGKYKFCNTEYKNSLSDEQKQALIKRGVPGIFTKDVI